MARQPSKKQIEANRKNAARSTGPRTIEGKERSRRNGLRHGMAAEVLVPEGDRQAYEAEMRRWERDAGPDNVVERHLIRRAAVGSVQLDRIERAKQEGRESAAREAVGRWERSGQARARRKAQDLPRDPVNTRFDLEATAFGCDWLIRQWQALEAPIRLGRAWDQRTLTKAHLLLGLPEGIPGADADRDVRALWILAAAASPGQVTALTRIGAEARLPTDSESARNGLRRFVAEQVDRLLTLREESWEAVEGPERDSIARHAASADTSKEGQLRHRYEVAADRSCSAAIRLYLNIRDRRRRELLTIAKEAGQNGTPRAPVGGGWWREVDSDPAPPGFARVDSPTEPTDAPPSPAEVAPEPEPVADRLDPTGSPKRTEPNSPADPTGNPDHKPQRIHALRNDHPDRPSDDSRRTGPIPTPPDRG